MPRTACGTDVVRKVVVLCAFDIVVRESIICASFELERVPQTYEILQNQFIISLEICVSVSSLCRAYFQAGIG